MMIIKYFHQPQNKILLFFSGQHYLDLQQQLRILPVLRCLLIISKMRFRISLQQKTADFWYAYGSS